MTWSSSHRTLMQTAVWKPCLSRADAASECGRVVAGSRQEWPPLLPADKAGSCRKTDEGDSFGCVCILGVDL